VNYHINWYCIYNKVGISKIVYKQNKTVLIKKESLDLLQAANKGKFS